MTSVPARPASGRVGRGGGRFRRAGVVMAALVVLGGGCGGPGPDAGAAAPVTSSTTRDEPATVPVTVPATGPVTAPATAPVTVASPVSVKIGFLGAGADAPAGPATTLSRTVLDGERLAVSQFTSDHPGIVVTLDGPPLGATDTRAAAAAQAHRLVADGVVAVIGPQCASEVRAALPILTAAGVPAVTATATATDLGVSGWTSFFRAAADDRQQGIAAADELVSALHLTSLAVLAGDAQGAQTSSAWVSSEAVLLGAVVSAGPAVVSGATAAAAARLAVSSGVGGVYFSGTVAVARALVTDLVADGYQGAVLIASDGTSSLLDPLGSTADGVDVASPAADPVAVAAHGGNGLVFDDAYRAAFGSEAPVWAAEAYDATNMILAAVVSGATTGATVATYLFNHPWVGVSGRLAFDSNGNQVRPPVFVSRIESGVAVQIATAAPASG